MAQVPTFFNSLVGGVVGAVAVVDVSAPGTDWGHCCHKLHESARELDGFVQQLTFIVGKVACCLRMGAEHLSRCLQEGRAPTSCACLMDKSDVDQGIDAGKQGAEYLFRGGRLVLEALFEGAKVVANRSLVFIEGTKEVVLRNIPYTQEKISQTYSSFLRGYHGGRSMGGGGIMGGYSGASSQPPYGQSYGQQAYGQPAPSSGAPPSGGGFFW